MKFHPRNSGRATLFAFSLAAFATSGLLLPPPALGQGQQFVVKPVTEKRVKQLPTGPLYWTVETVPTLEQAKAAESPLSLIAEVSGKVWLLTLGAKSAPARVGTKVVEIGPVPPLTAPEYLLRLNHAYGPPGSETPPHTHPGSEAFYVLSGRLGQKTSHGTSYADAGQAMNGHRADMPMIVFSAGKTDLDQLVMFVVDATKPFSSPAQLK